MPRIKKKKARKSLKYKSITIKVTPRQKKSLVNYCRSRKTTPNKIIKKAIGPLLNRYADLEVSNNHMKFNQLALFQMD